jgi:hypothetical protein
VRVQETEKPMVAREAQEEAAGVSPWMDEKLLAKKDGRL